MFGEVVLAKWYSAKKINPVITRWLLGGGVEGLALVLSGLEMAKVSLTEEFLARSEAFFLVVVSPPAVRVTIAP